MTWTFDPHTELSHNVVEVWVPSLGKWIVADPTFDAFVMVNGKPASALELHDAAEPDSASKISFDQNGAEFRLPQLNKYRKYFKHIFTSRTNALFDGYRFGFFARKKITFAHYVGPGVPPFPETEKERMLCAVLISAVVILFLSGQVIWRYARCPPPRYDLRVLARTLVTDRPLRILPVADLEPLRRVLQVGSELTYLVRLWSVLSSSLVLR